MPDNILAFKAGIQTMHDLARSLDGRCLQLPAEEPAQITAVGLLRQIMDRITQDCVVAISLVHVVEDEDEGA
jgi:hypothetical protein